MAFPNRFGTNKFGAKWTKTEDGNFASKGELARWNFLKDMQAAGKISNLRRQIRFKLEVNSHLICTYIADHGYRISKYLEPGSGLNVVEDEIIEDFKGIILPEFKLKKKLMLAIHGIDVKVVKKPTESYK